MRGGDGEMPRAKRRWVWPSYVTSRSPRRIPTRWPSSTIRFKTDQIGKGLDYTGLHHFGILVDDVEKFSKKVEGLGGRHYMDQGGDRVGGFEVKLYGPEGVLFDIAEHPWTGTEPLPVEKAEAAE